MTVTFNPIAAAKFTNTLQFKWGSGKSSAVLSLSGTGQAAAPTVPTKPTNLAATVLSSSQVSLSWQDNSNNETGFAVYMRRGGDNGFSIKAYGNRDDTSITISGLTFASRYEFYVVAFNDSGPSLASNTITVSLRSLLSGKQQRAA